MLNKISPLLCAALLMPCGELLAAPDRSAKMQFELSAQSLEEAVDAWAMRSGFQVIWPMERHVDVTQRVPKVSGSFSPDEALSLLLSRTGLTHSYLDDRTVEIRSKKKAAAAVSQTTKTKGPAEPHKDTKRDPELIDEVVVTGVVTGTHIRGVTPAGSQVIVIEPRDFRRSGHSTIEQMLASFPQNIRNGDNGESPDARFSAASGASNNVSFGSGLNLRGFGSTATLTLINSHRIAPSGKGAITDVSLIPVAAISRIEVLADGASAVYGADALAGVVNIILREDFDGADTRIRYGFTHPSGRDEVRASHTLGAEWQGGAFLTVVSYLDQTQLSVDERPITASVARPASILPSNRHVTALVSGHQGFGDSFTMRADAQLGRAKRFALGSGTTGYLEFPVEIDRANAAASVQYKDPEEGWDVSLQGQIGREDVDFSFWHFPEGWTTPAPASSEVQNLVQDLWSVGVVANGRLAEIRAGNIGFAVGALHREENYSRELLSPTVAKEGIGRSVDSAFVELHVPLVGEATAMRGARQINLSLAGRYEKYSDFGGIANPRLGVTWTLVPGLDIRGTYSTSFRAPAMGSELLSTLPGSISQVSIYSFSTADGSATVPMAFLTGPQDLRPEKSRNWTAGLTIRPPGIDGLQLDLTYYDIACADRIVVPPLDLNALSNPVLQGFIESYSSPAELQAALAGEAFESLVYADRTGSKFEGGAFGPNPERLATHLFDARFANAGMVRTSGFDFMVKYSAELMTGELDLTLNANFIDRLKTIFAPGAPAFDFVGTAGHPAGFRLRGGIAYAWEGWDAAFAANYTSGYTDTGTGAAIDMQIDSYITLDAVVSYTFRSQTRAFDNVSASLIVNNALNEKPPYIRGSLATRWANYSTENANALGRLIAMEISKDW